MKKKIFAILCTAVLVSSVMPVTAADSESKIGMQPEILSDAIQDVTGASENETEYEKDETTEQNKEVVDSDETEAKAENPDTESDIVEEKRNDVETDNGLDVEKNVIEQSTAVQSPQPVTAFTAKGVGRNIQLGWSSSMGAEGYIVYRKIGSGKFEYLYMVTKTSFLDTKASEKEYNFYRVYPYVTDETGKKIVGTSTAYAYAKPSLAAITNFTAKGTGNRQVTISWSKVDNAEGYIIYRQIGNEKMSYRYLVSGTSFIDDTVSNEVYSFYRVYPYYTSSSGTRTIGPSPNYVYAKGKIPAVVGIKAVSQRGGVKINWNNTSNVDGYLIYRKVGSGAYQYRYMTSGTQFIDTTASTAEYNFYWIFPYCNENGKMIVGGTAPYVYGKAQAFGKSSYVAGTYLVGRDIPAGEYVLSGNYCYFEICNSPPADDRTDNIIVNDLFRGNRYITLHNGEYYKFDWGVTYPLASAPKFQGNNGVYSDGMYLAGRDVQPGWYQLTYNSAGYSGYYEIKSAAYNTVPGNEFYSIIDIDSFTSMLYIKLESGQYLILDFANAVKILN